MKLNINKCKVLTVGRSKNVNSCKYEFLISATDTIELEHVVTMKDLDVTIDSELSFKDHIYDKINKAFQMLGIIKRSFEDLDCFSFWMLYKCLVRSHWNMQM